MLAVRVPLSGYKLSQASPLTVVVVDPRGTPFSDAQITLQGQAMPVHTNSAGVATFPSAPAGEAIVQVRIGQFTLRAKGPTDQTLFITVPICAPGPLLTGTELVALILGAAAAAGGVLGKRRPLEMLGEVLVGAGIFTAVYRHSCRW